MSIPLASAPFSEFSEYLRDDFPLAELLESATRLTKTRFSVFDRESKSICRRVRLFVPLYVANICVNHCRYCGFQCENEIPRVHLSPEEVFAELDILQGRGFRNILLVAAENPRKCTPSYFAQIITEMKIRGLNPAVEIAPQTVEGYRELAAAGCRSITLFQETYDKEFYRNYHPHGPKSSFSWRYETYSRAGEAGFDFFGFGILLGLAPPREELMRMVAQAREIKERFPVAGISFSLPRIRVAPHGFQPPFPVSDELFIRLYATLRMLFPDAELVLSTRETPEMRNRLYQSCITYTSAGSQTAPGGYLAEETGNFSGEQFPVTDHRSAAEVAGWLAEQGMVAEFG